MHPSASTPTRHRRVPLFGALLACIGLGIAVTKLGAGDLAGFCGDALYAVAAYLAFALVWVRLRPVPLAILTTVVCWGIEFFQATGVPSLLAQQWIGWRYLLGTTFNPVDLLAYPLGAILIAAVDAGITRARTR